MVFSTPEFVLFLSLFILLWHGFKSLRRLLLLTASYVFYGCWSPWFLLLIWCSTGIDFFLGRALDDSTDDVVRKRLVSLSIASNLGILGFFKYFDFFIGELQMGLLGLGLSIEPWTLNLILPVGISFYTFQTMSYTIDIYRRQSSAESDLVTFATFVAFFPQLVAGPIERSQNLLPQLKGLELAKPIRGGLLLIAMGVFKKVVLADNLALVVDPVFGRPDEVFGYAAWLATYAFAFQIYFDFSGYSDIAVGVARLVGVELMQNFNAPYHAHNPSEFWRRWHISLSSWLRDYLYIPLGGSRGTDYKTHRNLLLTMVLGGLWHGAGWTYIFWGVWHGLLLVGFRLLKEVFQTLPSLERFWFRVPRSIRQLLFFHLVCVGWVLFRSASVGDALEIFAAMINLGELTWSEWISNVAASRQSLTLITFASVIGVHLIWQIVFPTESKRLAHRLEAWPAAFRIILCTILFLFCIVFAPETSPPFIYFQF